MSIPSLPVALTLVLAVGCSNSSSRPPAPDNAAKSDTGEKTILFKRVRVFDGLKASPELDVLVRGDKIAEVGMAIASPAAVVIDGTGKMLLPGLIDGHTHVFESGQLRRSAVFGVTTVLDMMSDPKTSHDLKQRLLTAEGLQWADLRTAGNPVTAPKGHGTEYGLPVRTISGPDEAQAFVDACIAEGSDYIKLVVDNGHTYGIEFGNISKETLTAGIAAAHARKKLSIAHIGTQQNARDAIEVGVDGLGHLFVDSTPSPDFGAFVAQHRAFVIPTLSVNLTMFGSPAGAALANDPQLGPYLTDEDIESLKRSFPPINTATLKYSYAEETVRQLRDAGVAILAGTDAPNPGTTHGASLHGEIALLVQAGLSPSEALIAATSAPAERFGLTDRGRIAAGLRADLVLIKGDPTVDISSLRHIAGVWKQGTRIERDSYQAEIDKQRAEARGRVGKAPPGSESGLVSDFDSGEPSAAFGLGWEVSTDKLMGGTSTAELKVVPSGSENSKNALAISGEIIAASGANAWAGAMFTPGDKPMTPVDLSSKKEISFWAKGDGRKYQVLLYAKSRGFIPAGKTFEAGKSWNKYTFPLSQFDGMDGHDLMGMFFGAGPPAGKFKFQIDTVKIQ